MDSFTYWREFVASWGLLYFAVIFFVAIAYALWPSKRSSFEQAAQIPLIED
jgi:cytochrome c oxidase cbb3-type subunit IV